MQVAKKKRASALIVVLTSFIVTFGFSATSIMISNTVLQNANYNAAKLKSLYLANSGIEAVTAELKKRSVLSQGRLKVMDRIVESDQFSHVKFYSDDTFLGTYDANITILKSSKKQRIYRVKSQGKVRSGKDDFATTTAAANLVFQRAPSAAFQYVYYMNHFGWMSSNQTWVFNGNMGAAGFFNYYHSPLAVNGTPQFYDYDVTTGKLENPVKHINSENGTEDIEGGTIAGFEIQQSEEVTGDPYKEYPFQPQLPLPLLNKEYFKQARDNAYQSQSFIKIGDQYVCDGVYGDGQAPTGTENESWRQVLRDNGYLAEYEVNSGNLFLEGTKQAPIEIDGSVVVEGNLFIKGMVTGQGAISVRGNIYIGGDLEYVNPISHPRNATDKQSIELWILDNQDKDALGLYAKGTVGIGNYKVLTKNGTISHWLLNPVNESDEAKNGFDGMPNTGDFGEIDGEENNWNVERYSQEDADLGRIPEGFVVGDPIPGTGEDFDGDGKRDSRITQDDFIPRSGEDMEDAEPSYELVNSQKWGYGPDKKATPNPNANENAKGIRMTTLSNRRVRRLDAIIFTNKAVAGQMSGQGKLILNGAIMSRLEAMVVSGSLEFNFDRRIMTGGQSLGFIIPEVWRPVRVTGYTLVEESYSLVESN